MVDITVAVPTHNRCETVVMAVKSALAQTHPPRLVLVLADGCTDNTVKACRAIGDERIEVLDLSKAPGHGYAHRNLALERAGEGVVCWLGDDDLYLPNHVELVAQAFAVQEADLVTTGSGLIAPQDQVTATAADLRVSFHRDRLLAGENRTPSAGVAVRAKAALAVGGWDGDVPRGGDRDLWARMLRAGTRVGHVAVPTVLFFKATDREQDYRDRVQQNGRWLERLADPQQAARVQAELVLAASLRETDMERARRQLDEWVTQLNGDLQTAQREREELRGERDRLAAELDAVRAEHGRVAAQLGAAQAAGERGWSGRLSRRRR